jgi:hypothetical protein
MANGLQSAISVGRHFLPIVYCKCSKFVPNPGTVGSVSSQRDTDADPVDSDPRSVLERFAKMLEQKMLDGRTRQQICTWATDLGMPEEVFVALYNAIRVSWQCATTTIEAAMEQRDINRARYLGIYRRAMELDNLSVAVHVVKNIVDLDGLAAPKQLIVSDAPKQGAITNAARENVAALIEKMKALAVKQASSVEPHAAQALKRLEASANASANGHTNGHANGTNGKPVIDVPGDKKDD